MQSLFVFAKVDEEYEVVFPTGDRGVAAGALREHALKRLTSTHQVVFDVSRQHRSEKAKTSSRTWSGRAQARICDLTRPDNCALGNAILEPRR
jgi:hypothetical protein